jgi:DNA-binding NtrC family response regulator
MNEKKTKIQTRCSILAVDDSRDTLEVIRRNLEAAGYQVATANGAEQALAHLQSSPVDLLITDLKMPKVSGLDLLKHVTENYKDMEVMMITGFPCVNGAVQAIKDGAEEYLVKPFTDAELIAAVERMIDKQARRRAVQDSQVPQSTFGIVGESPPMLAVYRLIEKAASTHANILISGESGTGKELVARAVHYHSERRSAPFVPVNCTAIPDSLLESELFGHVKGAFTGAKDTRAGFFQIADGGTLFLDEIGDASLNLQSKLLRVLQDKEICMVGSSRQRKVDTRILAATHKDLPSLVKKGLFREDLFYRLDVIDIPVPPLSERGDDILLLIKCFIEKLSMEMHRATPRFSANALRILRNYHWPGNVRELENLMQRLMVIVDGDLIDVADLPAPMRFCVIPRSNVNRTLVEVEAEHIANVLLSVGGNKSQAAKILGIDRKTLRDKIKRIDGLSSRESG